MVRSEHGAQTGAVGWCGVGCVTVAWVGLAASGLGAGKRRGCWSRKGQADLVFFPSCPTLRGRSLRLP